MARGGAQSQGFAGDVRNSTSTPTKEDDSGGSEVVVEVNPLVASNKAPRPPSTTSRSLPPFIASHDLPRGAIFALHSLLAYALMLAVM